MGKIENAAIKRCVTMSYDANLWLTRADGKKKEKIKRNMQVRLRCIYFLIILHEMVVTN